MTDPLRLETGETEGARAHRVVDADDVSEFLEQLEVLRAGSSARRAQLQELLGLLQESSELLHDAVGRMGSRGTES